MTRAQVLEASSTAFPMHVSRELGQKWNSRVNELEFIWDTDTLGVGFVFYDAHRPQRCLFGRFYYLFERQIDRERVLSSADLFSKWPQ